jgi:predicted RecB family nuclease
MKLVDENFQLAATDLSNHLSCNHLTQLNRLVALDELKKPIWRDPSLDVLIQRGKEHEAAYVDYLSKKGNVVINLNGQGMGATLDAMKKGADVIVQGRLEHNQWMGLSDILIKVPSKPSKFGNWSYEVQDTKLAQHTKAATIIQLCLYSDLLTTLQGVAPEEMYVVKPGTDFPKERYRFAEFQSYYRLTKKNFEQFIDAPEQSTYPDPVEHCSICNWWRVCDKKRHDDDHLSLVAGIRSLHIEELKEQKINTLEEFANAKKIEKPKRGNKETFVRKQAQAKIQLDGRIKGQLIHDFIQPEPGRGLNRLPEPNAGDIYFDIEGDAFFENGGLEYILGYAYQDKKSLTYKNIWAINRQEEKKSFIQFMEFVMEHWKQNSNMYIYHFAPYEPAAIKRLARVHAVYEKEVDILLRAERFIDLHAVFKEALLASVESYSLKELEKFTKYTRKVELHDASKARKAVEVSLELYDFNSLPKETIEITEGYNEDDCLATHALHLWLEDIREKLLKTGVVLQRPELKTGEAGENTQQLDIRSQALFNALTCNLPEDRTTWNIEHHAKWLLAHMVDYFRRENKSSWWEYFRVHDLEFEDLLDERKAIAGLEYIGELPKAPRERNVTHRYKFPPQEITIDEGDKLVEVKGENIGTVKSISFESNTIDIKKTANAVDVHPFAIHVDEVINPGSLATSLMDLAGAIDEHGLEHSWPYHASKDLLMKRNPQLVGEKHGAYIEEGEEPVDAAIRIALNLDRSVLAIQGPPGTGKTYTGSRIIIELVKAGKKVGITAVSHKVIRNLAEATLEECSKEGVSISFVHKVREKSETTPDAILEVDKSEKALAGLNEGKVVCGTAWLWAEDNSREVLDYLFVDEAGQMSLSQVLAASRAAKNLILLGDPQQLEQPQKGAHPEGSDVAALTYLLDRSPTMPEGKGLFLGTTRRLHPNISKFTSEIFYEGKLHSLPGLEKQVLSGTKNFDGAGLFYVPVEHHGNQNKSLEEIEVVAKTVQELLKGSWTNAKGKTRPLTPNDILIVAPYNGQVSALMEKLPGMRIGTVDKFQGQEAPVVIYSMTASSIEDAPRGMGFLFSPNRLNVATSRAKSVCILVASPKLLEPECNTIDQMKWANALCRFSELAKMYN